ncbi:MAG: hypothetical protein KAX84_09720 [Burkholderiales bacterium]|nr:hypothetical protein [Burkholderiales bacterium]
MPDTTKPAKKPRSPRKAKAEQPDTTPAIKAFDADFSCRGHQFEVGKTYEVSGKVELCENGFHACHAHPLDVWRYYPVVDDRGRLTRYADVQQGGARDIGEDKTASARISIVAEIDLAALVRRSVAFVLDLVKGVAADVPVDADDARIGSSGNGAQIGSSGNDAQIGSSGYGARIGSSGNDARIGSSGNGAQIGSSGYGARIGSSGNDAQIGSSGNGARIGSSGNDARIGSSGNDARIGSSGYGARIGSSGNDATIACAARDAVVTLGPGGCAALAWHDGKRVRFATIYEGEDGIKAGAAYRVRDGRVVEVA